MKQETTTNTEQLFEKAELVSRRMIELREALDEAVFRGISDDGIVEIGLYGDGRPESVELHLDGPEETKRLFASDILEALQNIFVSRVERLEDGMKSIQDEAGVGPDFEMPF